MKCGHLGCEHVGVYEAYQHHADSCPFNPDNPQICETCGVLNNVVHRCKDYVRSPRDSLTRSRTAFTRLEQSVSVLERELNPAREATIGANRVLSPSLQPPQSSSHMHVSQSAESRHDDSRFLGVHVLSNHIRCRSDHRSRTQFWCRFRGREVHVSGLDLKDDGNILRARLERELGELVDPILKFNHTPLVDSMRLRQHQIDRKPIYLVALERDRIIEGGKTTRIFVGLNGHTI